MEYTDKVCEYFRNPKNMGKIENADGESTVGNPICGDVMKIYIKVKDNRIDDIKFETFGCGAAIATSSVVTELAKGKTLEEAEKISNKEVVDFLGGLPPIKKHCSLLAEEGLKSAIKAYRERQTGSLNEKAGGLSDEGSGDSR